MLVAPTSAITSSTISSISSSPSVRGALVGALAAAAWQACDPVFKRTFRTPYSDAELLGPFITRGRYEWLADLVTHSAGGAAFGFLFERFGGSGVKQGVVVALAENTLLWPVMPFFDRTHPDVRSGRWPKLFANGRVFAQASAAHVLFGALLGALGPR